MTPDERRAKFRVGLSTLYLPVYDTLCGILGPEWGPYYGYRTFQEQDQLYAQGRTKFPIGGQHIVTQARGGESPHNYGCASDWILWGEKGPIWLAAGDDAWQPYLAALDRLGLRAGAHFSHEDYPHNELKIDCDWKHVLLKYKANGMTAAQQHIELNLVSNSSDSTL